MPNEDSFTITVLEDGTLKIEFDQVSPANHKQADELLKTLLTSAGGKATTQRRKEHVHAKQNQRQKA